MVRGCERECDREGGEGSIVLGECCVELSRTALGRLLLNLVRCLLCVSIAFVVLFLAALQEVSQILNTGLDREVSLLWRLRSSCR